MRMRTTTARHASLTAVAAATLATGLLIAAAGTGGAATAPHSAATTTTNSATGGATATGRAAAAATAPGLTSAPGSIKTISSDWSIPWGLSWLPDGSALITERDTFKVFTLAQDGTKKEIGKVPNVVTTGGEGGLLSIAVSPSWKTDHYVYLMHTASEGNRIARMTFNGGKLSGYKVLVDGIKKNKYHDGGRLKFGPDGYLYATTGEAQDRKLAQDKSSLNGKILRMTTDGKPAPGNPFGTLLYSYGHRNPQGITWDAQGRLWEAEFGDAKYDELNLIEPGKNYGWPTCEGTCSVDGMTNPKRQWPVSEASPSAVAYADGAIYMAALRGQRLWRIPVDGTTAGTPKAYYTGDYGRLRTVETVPGKNSLWLTTTNADNNGKAGPGSDKVFQVDLK